MSGMSPRCLSMLLAGLLLFACSKSEETTQSPDGGLLPTGVGYGGICTRTSDCRPGYDCEAARKICLPSASVLQGGTCWLSAECVAGNYCTQQGICAPSGAQPAGGTCTGEGDCASGLICAAAGLSGVCQAPGTADLNGGCLQTSDCLAGLMCWRGQCTKGYMTSPPVALTCPSEEVTARVLFHVPRATDSPANMDFYRLPFPNDIRRKAGGGVDLQGHPQPGATVLPFDLVARYVDAIETEATGFGANQTVYFRFSRAFDTSQFPGDCGSTLVDITPTSPTYGLNMGMTCVANNTPTSYLCGPYLAVRPSLGAPLRPGTTYALLVRKAFVDVLGTPFGPDDDFTALLAATPPTDPELAVPYAAYQPLRDYIAAGQAAAADLAAAAVFTVEKYEDPMAAIAAAVAVAQAPQIEGLVRCDDPAAVSPCDDNKLGAEHVRGCLAADAASANFTTYQGTLTLPEFQQGVPPYLTPADGGGIAYAADGVAVLQRSARVCFALTVPKGVAPAAGWPLVVYGHGTGGSYRSIVDLGLSEDYALGVAPAGLGVGVDGGASATPTPLAVLSYDGIMHGTRNGGSTKPVGELVYNFLNPVAARDNALQAAADLLAIPRSLASFAAQGIVLDGKRLSLYGHSQGGNAAALVAARESPYGTIVMSGTGGTLIYTLLGKTKPINIPAVLPFVLGETGTAALTAYHPVLNLMQMYFERSDSVNFGRRLFKEPTPGMTPHHVLHVYGLADSYSVVTTQQAYGLAAHFRVSPPILDAYGLAPLTTASPYSNNEYFGTSGNLTALQIQYQSDGTYDGHFVSTDNPRARAAIHQMLVTAARDGIPTVMP
jgi:predicted esterase